jgi:hypothetical protein
MKGFLRKTVLAAAIMALPAFCKADNSSLIDAPAISPVAPSAFQQFEPTLQPSTQDAPAAKADEPLMMEDAPLAKKLSGVFSVAFPTKYLSRGLILNRSAGVIAQPSAELDFDLFDSKGVINKITPYIGIWNDVTSNHQYANGNLSSWYEFDWDVGVSIDFLKNWNFNVQYIEFTSPSNAFGTSKNIIPQITYNDSDLWGGKFALNPYVAGLIETNGKAGSGVHLGYYVEPGIAPSFTFMDKSDYPLTLTVPVKAGLGFSNFYGGKTASHNATFGYFSAGVVVGVPLKFMDSAVGGSWSANAGAAYYYYGPGTHYFNTAVQGFTNKNDVIGSAGVTVKF